jgi:hypothetical protein
MQPEVTMRFRAIPVILLILLLVLPAHAEMRLTKRLSVDAEARYRTILENTDFLEETGYNEFTALRTMLGVTYRTSRDVTLRFKFKESRYLGMDSQGTESTAKVHMQESYVHAKNLWGSPLEVQFGRFEMGYGRYRIIGISGWNDYGPAAYDGIRFQLNRDTSWYHLAYFKASEGTQSLVDPTAADSKRDSHVGVLAASFADGLLEPLIVAEFDEQVPAGYEDNNMRITAGTYMKYKRNRLSVEADGAYQMGTLLDRDVASWLAALDLGYRLGGSMRWTVGAGVDATSGSTIRDDRHDLTDATFYTPYGSRHRFKGYMDFFGDENRGLIDSYFRLTLLPFRRVGLEIVGHNFAYMNPKVLEDDSFTMIGQEVDTRIRTRVASGFSLTAGYSFLIPTDDYSLLKGGYPGHWSYLAYITLTGTL